MADRSSEHLDGVPKFGSRRWIAWKLVRIARRIYDAEYDERIIVTDPHGEELTVFEVVGDMYSCGISSQSGATTLGDGYGIAWVGVPRPRGDA